MEFELPPDFRELFELLNANNVRYLLLGGYAVGAYGYPRATNDLDVFVSDDHENVEHVTDALAAFGFPESQKTIDAFLQPRSMLEMGVEPMKIRIMNFADGINFDEAFDRKTVFNIAGINVNVLSRVDLIANKKAVGRHKDLDDVERLEKE